jgi:hypothetical protein
MWLCPIPGGSDALVEHADGQRLIGPLLITAGDQSSQLVDLASVRSTVGEKHGKFFAGVVEMGSHLGVAGLSRVELLRQAVGIGWSSMASDKLLGLLAFSDQLDERLPAEVCSFGHVEESANSVPLGRLSQRLGHVVGGGIDSVGAQQVIHPMLEHGRTGINRLPLPLGEVSVDLTGINPRRQQGVDSGCGPLTRNALDNGKEALPMLGIEGGRPSEYELFGLVSMFGPIGAFRLGSGSDRPAGPMPMSRHT